MAHDRSEIEKTIQRYLELRRGAIAGDIPWTALAEVFTDDAVFIDSVWGRHDGLDAVVEFLDASMRGLDDWDFPHLWEAIDGDRVFLRWSNRLPGATADGRPLDNMGLSILEYAGDGRFSYEEDMYSESHLMQVMKQSDWSPSPDMVAPPPDRDWVQGIT